MKRLLLILTLLGYSREGITLSCYQCNSDTDPHCLSEEVLDIYLTPCPPPRSNHTGLKTISFCSNLQQWLYFTKKARYSVVRGCTHYHKFKEICSTVKDGDSFQRICVCNTEGCNSALPLQLSKYIWFASLSLVILHLYFLFVSLFPT
ncbi:hypothetical protein WA026_001506 [Henosepilachna vigintioctopunctata]|uniref:Protein quiver n=1 Tax=Henosepilachna vigintioctopunctata TaxID=420089 RepID=A0AAW1UKT1_9CUCU